MGMPTRERQLYKEVSKGVDPNTGFLGNCVDPLPKGGFVLFILETPIFRMPPNETGDRCICVKFDLHSHHSQLTSSALRRQDIALS